MADEAAEAKPIACSGLATCECPECGPLPDKWLDTPHEFMRDPVNFRDNPDNPLCSLCDGEEDDEIHVEGPEYKDPALSEAEEEPASELSPPPIASEETKGALTHVVLQWGSKQHMLRYTHGNGRSVEGVPVAFASPCFLRVEGVTYMALSAVFPEGVAGIYKVERLP